MLNTLNKKLEQRNTTGRIFVGLSIKRFVDWSTRCFSVGIVSLLIVNTTAFGQDNPANTDQPENIGAPVAEGSIASITIEDGQILVKPQNISRRAVQFPTANEMGAPVPQDPSKVETNLRQRPVPDAAAQRESLKKVREIFKDAYSDRSAATALAALLLKTGLETGDSPDDQYVLFDEALVTATSIGNVEMTLQTIEALAERFAVDSNELHLDAFKKLFGKSPDPQSAHQMLIAANRILDQMVDADQYPAASQLVSDMYSVARKKKLVEWQTQLKDRTKLVREFSKTFRSLESEFSTLKGIGYDDEAANLAIGKFYCFQKGNFSAGLPYLELCGDETLTTLAIQELTNPTQPDTIKKLADGWWELAEQFDEPAAREIQMHAQTWYAKVIGNLQGLERQQVQLRLMQGANINAYSLVAPASTFEIVWTNEAGDKVMNSLEFYENGKFKRFSANTLVNGSWTLEGNTVTVVALGLPRIEYYFFQDPDTFSCQTLVVQPDNSPAKLVSWGTGVRSKQQPSQPELTPK